MPFPKSATPGTSTTAAVPAPGAASGAASGAAPAGARGPSAAAAVARAGGGSTTTAKASPSPLATLYHSALGPVGLAHYLRVFALFDATGKARPGWNWGAALLTLHWMLLHQLWRPALAYAATGAALVWLAWGIDPALLPWPASVQWGLLAGFVVLGTVLPGLYGDALLHAYTEQRIHNAIGASKTIAEARLRLGQHASSRQRAGWQAAIHAVLLCVAAAIALFSGTPPRRAASSAAPEAFLTPSGSTPAASAPTTAPASDLDARLAAAAATAVASAMPAPAALPTPQQAVTAAVAPPPPAPAPAPQAAPAPAVSPPAQSSALVGSAVAPASGPASGATAGTQTPAKAAPTAAPAPKPLPPAVAEPAPKVRTPPPTKTRSADKTAPEDEKKATPPAKTPTKVATPPPAKVPAKVPAKTPAKASTKVPAKTAAKVPTTPPATAALATTAAATDSADTPAHSYFINTGSFADASNAARVLLIITGSGLPAVQQEVTGNQNTYHRVRVGPFYSREQADRAAASLRKMRLEAVVYRR